HTPAHERMRDATDLLLHRIELRRVDVRDRLDVAPHHIDAAPAVVAYERRERDGSEDRDRLGCRRGTAPGGVRDAEAHRKPRGQAAAERVAGAGDVDDTGGGGGDVLDPLAVADEAA